MYKLYSRISDHETILETWGASTKHPDATFYFSDFNKSPYSDEFCQIFPWLLECASRMTWVSHAYSLGEFAFECYNAIIEARKIELKIEKSA